jgi:hypothetical protein
MIACTRGPPRGARPGAAGAQVPGVRGVTTPLDVANALSKSLAKRVVVAEADGAEWDLFRPLRAPCALRLHTFDDDLGKHVRGPRRVGHRVGERVGQRRELGTHVRGPHAWVGQRAGPLARVRAGQRAGAPARAARAIARRARQALRGASLRTRLGRCGGRAAGGGAIVTCPVRRHVRAAQRPNTPCLMQFVHVGSAPAVLFMCISAECPARRRSGTAARTCWARRWRRASACG